jgi:hypothetical protein
MAERIEFVGNPLPTGLPGFGGGTVSVLVLPGFNTVVAVQQFGPVVDAPTVTPPDSEPPPGSNPENPTNEVVDPAPPPNPPNQTPPNFCERCVPPDFPITSFPLMMAMQMPSGCEDCQGFTPGTVAQPEIAADSNERGIFWEPEDGITGKVDGNNWSVNTLRLKIDNNTSRTELLVDELVFSDAGETTFYQRGPKIKAPDGKVYEPQDLDVCVDGETQTWKVLAYKPD